MPMRNEADQTSTTSSGATQRISRPPAQCTPRTVSRAAIWVRSLVITGVATAVFACDSSTAPPSSPDAPPKPRVSSTLQSGIRSAVYQYKGAPQPVYQFDTPSTVPKPVLTT